MFPAARATDEICHGGVIVNGSENVLINGLPAGAVCMSEVECSLDGPNVVADGSDSVFINGFPAARMGDPTACGAAIVSGSDNVLIGD